MGTGAGLSLQPLSSTLTHPRARTPGHPDALREKPALKLKFHLRNKTRQEKTKAKAKKPRGENPNGMLRPVSQSPLLTNAFHVNTVFTAKMRKQPSLPKMGMKGLSSIPTSFLETKSLWPKEEERVTPK